MFFLTLRRKDDCHISDILTLKVTSDEYVEEDALCTFKRYLRNYTVDDTVSAAQEVFSHTNCIYRVPYLS